MKNYAVTFYVKAISKKEMLDEIFRRQISREINCLPIWKSYVKRAEIISRKNIYKKFGVCKGKKFDVWFNKKEGLK